jgi:hypothetical protein
MSVAYIRVLYAIKMRAKLLLLQAVLSFGCGCNEAEKNANLSKRDSLLYEQQLAKEYKKSGKGLFLQNCASCHNFSKIEDGQLPFIDIVKIRSSAWTYELLTDSNFTFKSGAESSSNKVFKNHMQFQNLSKHDVDSIWNYAIKEQNTISY